VVNRQVLVVIFVRGRSGQGYDDSVYRREGNLMNGQGSAFVLRDVPVFLWIFGLIFMGVGILIIYEGGPPAIIALIMIALGLGILLFTSVLTITADRAIRMLELDSRSIVRHTVIQVPFDEIIGINLERSISRGRGGSSFVYRLALLRKDGQVVPFRSYSSSGRNRKERWAGQLREVIGIQHSNRTPPGMLPLELSQATEIHETNGVKWQIHPMMTQSASAPTGARWYSPEFKTPGVFLFLAQKAEGQASGGFLASLGKMFIRQALSLHGFQPEDTPGLDQALTLDPLDPAIERYFLAYTNSPDGARRLLNSTVVTQLANWAGRYPLKQFQSGSRYCQLMTLFGPNGVYVAAMNLLQPSQAYELISFGVELVKSQSGGRAQIFPEKP
jgi:hypothetical protein